MSRHGFTAMYEYPLYVSSCPGAHVIYDTISRQFCHVVIAVFLPRLNSCVYKKLIINPICTRACYDEGKRCAETLFFDYHRQHNLDIKVVRIFNTYGPRMHPNDGRVVSNFIVQALRGEDITIYGDGQQSRSFCYVDDMIDGFVRMMNSERGLTGPVNMGNPVEFTMLELAENILRIVAGKSKLTFKPLPADDPRQRQPDISQARSKLNWEPKVSLEDGLKETILYFKRLLKNGDVRSVNTRSVL